MKKSIVVWIFGCLTFFAGLHTFDAVLSLASNSNSTGSLLQLYPFYDKINEIVGKLDAVTYFWLSLLSTLAFMGVMCSIAFYDPILAYVKKVISETKIDDSQADLKLDSELTAFSMINESLTTQGVLLNNVKSELSTLKNGISALKIDMTRLRGKIGGLETDLAKLRKCPACGKNVLPQFKFCPHCGEKLSLYVLVRRLSKHGSDLTKKELVA
ncbi:MAG: zinc ribbon domain-containing protein [Candidatus Bathyarchaeota archaeon]|nr:zinc ribbon domain-containing protein [Candidatus Bathyarchaeota archaeon]